MTITPSISLCMIVKDEEEWIAQCLQSVSPIISEIIVVDTGSADDTVRIAESFGAKVFFREWTDDFSDVRNFSLSKATSDWILVLDADEAIASEELSTLQQLTGDDSICYEFLQRHYSNDHRLSFFKPCRGEYREWERHYGGFFESNLVRLFPRHPGISYRGRVHELVEHSIRDLGKHRIVRTRIPIHHYGHTEEVRRKKKKSQLYSPLGEEKLREDPTNWQAFFEMGVEHNVNGRYSDSVEAFLKSLALNPQYVPTWVNMGYVLCEMEKYKEAISALMKAIQLDKNCHEGYCNLGVVFLRIQDFKRAEHALVKAVELNPKYINAYCNLGKALIYQERYAEAVNIYQRALKLLPNCATAKADLGALYLHLKQHNHAEKYLLGAVESDPFMSIAYLHLGQLYKEVDNVTNAVKALEKYCEIEEQNDKAGPNASCGEMVTKVRQECETLREKIGTDAVI
jgi:tetratricopeptide (TPR) repeat protein